MLAEILTLVGLIGIAVLSMWLMTPGDAKSIVGIVVPGLLGYLTRGVVDKITEKTVEKAPE